LDVILPKNAPFADVPTMKSQGFTKSEHLRRTADFDVVYRTRKSARDGRLIVHARANGLTHSRLGLSVGGKFGNSVHRNKFRRRCKEAFRLHKRELPIGFDLVIRPAANLDATLAQITESLLSLARAVCARSA
jgi:ribonuclease P protein component